MRRSGFTLLEMIIVLGVLSVTAGIAVPVYRDYQIKSDLNLATEQVAQGIERARLLSQTSTDDSGWGFRVRDGLLFKGQDSITRDPAFDEVYPMPSTITVHNLYEVAFDKMNGKPSATGAIKLTTINDAERTISIEVFEESIAVTTPDMIPICIGGALTQVQEHEVLGLLEAGASYPENGTCVTAQGAASSEVAAGEPSSEMAVSSATSEETTTSEETASSEESASESSVMASEATSSVIIVGGSSSAPGGGGGIECDAGQTLICHVPPGNPSNRNTLCVDISFWPTHRAHGDTLGACETEIEEPIAAPVCTDRFVIGEDHSLTLTGTADVTLRVLGSEITFGPNGPDIPVILWYLINGKKKMIFDHKKGVQGGEEAVINNVPAGAIFAVQAKGEYREQGSLQFSNTILSGDGSGYFNAFQNGAPLPNYPVFGGQAAAASFLDGYLAADGTVAIGPYDVLLLGELGASLTNPSADFQDIVVLLQFGEPDCD